MRLLSIGVMVMSMLMLAVASAARPSNADLKKQVHGHRARLRRDHEGARPGRLQPVRVRRSRLLFRRQRRCAAATPSSRPGANTTKAGRRRFPGSRSRSKWSIPARWPTAADRSWTPAASSSAASIRSGGWRRRGSGRSCSTAARRRRASARIRRTNEPATLIPVVRHARFRPAPRAPPAAAPW